MKRFLNPYLSFLWATLACVLLSGFGQKTALARTGPAVESTLRRTILVLEGGENALSARSADHRQILNSVLEALPPDAREFVRSDIRTLLRRLPGKGADFECGSGFLRLRTRQELERIKDKLLNTSPLPPEPEFCYAVPFAVDLGQPLKNLEIYGYDLDTQPLELFVLNKDGSFEDVSSALTMRTHYHLTVDFGPHGLKFSPLSQMVSVAWGHIIRYSISLIQPATDLCMSQLEEIPAGKAITLPARRITGIGGLGAGGSARVSAMLNYESNKVDATVCVTATDKEKDPATFAGCGVEYVYTTDQDRVIEGVYTELESLTSQVYLNPGSNIVPGRRDSPVSKWVLDIPGAQSPKNLQVTAVLTGIRIVSTKIDNCVPAIAYLEARRRNAIASATARRLDSESRNVQHEILKLRPRFAP